MTAGVATMHGWAKSSGTTETCAKCGCVKVVGGSSALPRGPSEYASWLGDRWTQPWDRFKKKEPPCLPDERGHSVPKSMREGPKKS